MKKYINPVLTRDQNEKQHLRKESKKPQHIQFEITVIPISESCLQACMLISSSQVKGSQISRRSL